jgi:hypothetical protein
VSRYSRVLVNIGLAAVLVGMLPGLVAAGNGVGAAFNLGVKNTVTAVTKLVATTSNAALLVQNTGTGPGLQITVGAGKAPITVPANAGKATNLNADKLDGLDSTALQGKITQLSDLNAIGCGPNGRLLLATSAITCISENWEPNDTQGAAATLYNPSNTSATVGGGDVDWYLLDSPPCNGTQCVFQLGLDSVNVLMDVYMDGTLKASAVRAYAQFDSYTGATPVYTVRVYSTKLEPYKLSYTG